MLSGPQGDPYECLIKPTLAELLKENVFVRFIHFDVAHRRASCWIETVSKLFLDMSQRLPNVSNSVSGQPPTVSVTPPPQNIENSGSKDYTSAPSASSDTVRERKSGTKEPKTKKKRKLSKRKQKTLLSEDSESAPLLSGD